MQETIENKMRISVLISGNGTNLQALIDACSDPGFPAQIVLVISNVADAYGLERARESGIDYVVVDHKKFNNRNDFENCINIKLQEKNTELVCLAGFMRILTPQFVNEWHDRIINIHPSLLPAYKGLNTHARAIEEGARFGGCTVHFVRPELDDGPVILQAAVPIVKGDTAQSLGEKVLVEEHKIYPQAVRMIAEGLIGGDSENMFGKQKVERKPDL